MGSALKRGLRRKLMDFVIETPNESDFYTRRAHYILKYMLTFKAKISKIISRLGGGLTEKDIQQIDQAVAARLCREFIQDVGNDLYDPQVPISIGEMIRNLSEGDKGLSRAIQKELLVQVPEINWGFKDEKRVN